MSSHLRFHGFPLREPWAYGVEAESIVRQCLELRYRLLPYLWRVVDECSSTGLPMGRATVLAYPDDPNCRHIDDQYLLGTDVMIAPILTERDDRAVYIPTSRGACSTPATPLRLGGTRYTPRWTRCRCIAAATPRSRWAPSSNTPTKADHVAQGVFVN